MCLLVAIACLFQCRQNEPVVNPPINPSPPMSSTYSFKQGKPLSNSLLETPFQLASTPRYIKLPDVRSVFLYYGCNERPDRNLGQLRFQFGLRGSSTVCSVQADEKVYLRFDGHANKWTISETPTILTASFSPLDTGVAIRVTVFNEDGTAITTPHELHFFTVLPTPMPQTAGPESWTLGDEPVDNSILDRQGAIWWGQDEVIHCLGGEEMKEQACRERIQFGTDHDAYVLWMAEGDCFVFDQNRWIATSPGQDSLKKPLLRVKSIDQRTIRFDLWDAEGSRHIAFELPKRDVNKEVSVPKIKLIGAKSRRSWIAEIQGKRIVLAPDDWIVLTQHGFVTLDTTENLEDFIEGRIMGELFAFSGIERVNGEMCLVGTFFDMSRTCQEQMAISLYHSWKPTDHLHSSRTDDEETEDFEEFDEDDENDDDDLTFDEIEDDEEA